MYLASVEIFPPLEKEKFFKVEVCFLDKNFLNPSYKKWKRKSKDKILKDLNKILKEKDI